jgi:uncharacterized cupredoxin-like copper-binding protein
MNKAAIAVGLIVSHITCASPINTHAAGDLTKQDPIEVTVQLGNPANELRFFPGKIELETGKLYRVVIKNPSPQKHYFSSENLSQSVFTRKVRIPAMVTTWFGLMVTSNRSVATPVSFL